MSDPGLTIEDAATCETQEFCRCGCPQSLHKARGDHNLRGMCRNCGCKLYAKADERRATQEQLREEARTTGIVEERRGHAGDYDQKKGINPKDAIGVCKAPQSCVSRLVVAELGLALLEGACKYGRHNYRVAPVRASVYFDAALRHLDAWYEGQDIDPDSGISHLTKAMACLAVVRDAEAQGSWVDDRPPPSPDGWQESINKQAASIIAKYPQPKQSFVAADKPKR